MEGVKEALKRRPGAHSSILLDTKGPEIRTGKMVDDKPITL
jgi:pyruvate kinase